MSHLSCADLERPNLGTFIPPRVCSKEAQEDVPAEAEGGTEQ